MGSAFHQLCPRYNGTLTPTAPTATRLWETFTFTFFLRIDVNPDQTVLNTVDQDQTASEEHSDKGLHYLTEVEEHTVFIWL